MRKLIRHLRMLWYAVLCILLLLLLVLSVMNGETLKAVEIRLLPDQADYNDRRIPLLTKGADYLPDYQLQYQLGDHWNNIGTIPNKSAKDWLTYDLAVEPCRSLVQRVRVVEDDPLEDDLLDEVALLPSTAQGTMFEFRFHSGYSFKAGLDWFFDTPIGKAIAVGISIAIALLVLSKTGI